MKFMIYIQVKGKIPFVFKSQFTYIIKIRINKKNVSFWKNSKNKFGARINFPSAKKKNLHIDLPIIPLMAEACRQKNKKRQS